MIQQLYNIINNRYHILRLFKEQNINKWIKISAFNYKNEKQYEKHGRALQQFNIITHHA